MQSRYCFRIGLDWNNGWADEKNYSASLLLKYMWKFYDTNFHSLLLSTGRMFFHIGYYVIDLI